MTLPPEDMLEFFRKCGAALCLAGETASRIPEELSALADAYGLRDVEFLVVPTGVFVRVAGEGGVTVDFANADKAPLRLDQVDALYKLMEQVKAVPVPPAEAIAKLEQIMAAPPRFGAVVSVLGHGVLTVGIGLMFVREARALLILAALGLLVGILRLLADRVHVLSLALPVAAAMAVTVVAYRFSPQLGTEPASLLIPPLATFLPGAALTLGAQEMVTRSIISGASRLVAGTYVLLLLTFGIYAGMQLAGPVPAAPPVERLGLWAAWVGVVVFGLGIYINSSAPARSLPWLLLTLLIAYGAQYGAGLLADSLFAAFVGGLVIVPMAIVVQRLGGPPAQVVFLPAFWLLVPGALGLIGTTGATGLLALAPGGKSNLATALLTVVAVSLGVLVGSSLMANVKESSRLATARAV
ncbi:threonine/serine ThrE exporter family protein [Catellatospora tritici]|uniref:threonine/serine ThrE exporter family protein n=1 Tax=Catellatospora tritici TaxID=2851566 RepID=UPI001C2D7AA0|nr:threonine/serine exporter family protein [Catellatospora tritici]MBV1855498.1 threonine/serine exporter family protein [Catellatospora tritici]